MKTLKYVALTSLACACFMGLAPTASAIAMQFNDPNDLGMIEPGSPASQAEEISYINILIVQGLGTGPTNINGRDYTRTMATPAGGASPVAVLAGALRFENQGNQLPNPVGGMITINLGSGGWTYLLGKYGNASEVWYVAGMSGNIQIPVNSLSPNGLSHVSLFRAEGNVTVPEGGSTIALLGLALIGAEVFRRSLRRRGTV